MKFPKAPEAEDRKKMAIAFIESPAFEGIEFDVTMVNLIREGYVMYEHPDKFRLTQEGYDHVQENKGSKLETLLAVEGEDDA